MKKPSITKLATSDISRNVGKKPSNSRYSKRKGKESVASRVKPSYKQSLPMNVVSSNINDGSSGSTTSLVSSSGLLSNTCTRPVPSCVDPGSWYPNWDHMNPYPNWSLDMNPYQPNWMSRESFFPPGGPSFPVPYPWHTGMMGTSTSSTTHVNTSNELISPTVTYLFWVYKLNKRITTCFGCRGKFTRSADGGIPIAPMDLIFQCNESRSYYDKDGNSHEKEHANTYYHPNITCIKQKHPEFKTDHISVEDQVRDTLLPVHLELLHSVFDIQL